MKKKREKLIRLIAVLSFFGIIFILLTFLTDVSITGKATYESATDGSTINDTYIRQPLNNNFGTESILRLGKISTGANHNILIKDFNISVPVSDTIIYGKLQVYIENSYGSSNITVKAYRISSDWNEYEVGWNNRTSQDLWIYQGGDYEEELDSISIENTSGIYYNFTITEAVNGWINGSYQNQGIILIATDSVNGNYSDISSSESATVAYRPKFIIEHSENAPPIINDISDSTSTNSPALINEIITFEVNWTELESDSVQIFICNSGDVNISGCNNLTYCNTSYESTSPSTCTYQVQSSDIKNSSYYVSACDNGNCTVSSLNNFYINHLPSAQIIDPNGGETINQSLGNYTIKFLVNDTDSDNLFASIYYSQSQYQKTNTINTKINLTNHCTDIDSNTATTNNCSYPWNSTGIYGTYYLNIFINDTFSESNDSSDSNFNVVSLTDNNPPIITSTEIDSNIYEGMTTLLSANISEENINTVWAEINTTPTTTLYLQNYSDDITYSINWTATLSGNYQYKIFANDTLNNINNTLDWQSFYIREPNATAQNEYSPSIALPYHVVKISGELNATDAIKDVTAYLNVPDRFTFLSDYPQNQELNNFSDSEIKNIIWYVTVPLTETTYTMNITYTDMFSNSWQSSNMNIQVSSAIGGGYLLSSSGYPEVETSYDYFVEGYFTNSGTYADADSVIINIYDSTDSLIVGPVSMNNPQTGIYNYTYTVPAAPNEGLWKTIINATRLGTSYYSVHYWKVVGGPFDIRDINIINSSISNLNISFIAENTGGADKDLIMSWNLTVESNDSLLDTGGETFMVSSNSNRTWYIKPTTSFIGQVKITILGYYSGTEKVGAYHTFSTTSGGEYCGDNLCNNNETCSTCPNDCGSCSIPAPAAGGGGGSTVKLPTKNISKEVTEYNLEIIDYKDTIFLTKNIEKEIKFKIKNIGKNNLNNIKLKLYNLFEGFVNVDKNNIKELKPGETTEFTIKFLIIGFTGEQDFYYNITTDNNVSISKKGKIIVLSISEYFAKEIERLLERSNNLQSMTNDSKIIKEILLCEDSITIIKDLIDKERYIDANNQIKLTDDCFDNILDNLNKETPKKFKLNIKDHYYQITWILILILIIGVIILILFVNKKLGIINYIKENVKTEHPVEKEDLFKSDEFTEKIESIRKKFKS